MQRKSYLPVLSAAILVALWLAMLVAPASAQRPLPPANVYDEQHELGERPATPALEAFGPTATLVVDGSCPDTSPMDGICDDNPLEYKTITAAISAASGGDTISVLAGSYYENILVNKSLTLAGAGQASTFIFPAVSNPNPCVGSSLCGTITAASNIIGIQASDVTIHGFTLDGDNTGLTSGIVVNGADLDARNGIIEDFYSGVFNNLVVYDTTVKNIYLRGIYVSSGGTGFNIHHTTIDNVMADPSSIALFTFGGSGTFANNTVSRANDAIAANHSKGTQFLDNVVTTSGSGVHTDNAGSGGGSADLIQGNSVSACASSGYGIWVFVPYIAPTVNNNSISDCEVGLSAWGDGATLVSPYTPVTTLFTNNTVDGPASAANSVGVYVTTDWISWGYSDISVSFSGNVITDYETGLYFTADQQLWNPEPYVAKTIDATFLDNSIAGNTNGAGKGTSGTYNLNASGNWWGSNVPATVATTVGAGIDYTPWLAVGTDTSGSPGFQGDFSTLWVDDDSPQTGATGRIQEGIDLVTASTVNVAAGSYSDPINIDGLSNLTVRGVDKATVLIKPTSVLDWNACGHTSGRKAALRVVNSTNVVLEQMTIDMDLVKANFVFGFLYCNSTGTVNNNVMKNLGIPDSGGGYYELGGDFTAPAFSAASPAAITISDNEFIDTGRVGVVTHFYVDATITGNTFHKTWDDFGYAMEIGGPSVGEIRDNIIYGFDTPADDGSESAGIYIENAFTESLTGITKDVSVEDNEIYGSQYGLWIGNGWDTFAGDVDIVVTLNNNNIHDNTLGGLFIQDEDKEYGSSVTVIGSENTVTNNGAVGYYIYTEGDGAIDVDLTEDTITGHVVGIDIEDTTMPEEVASGLNSSSYAVTVNNSNLSGNTSYGMRSNVPSPITDGEENWWGSPCGPSGEGPGTGSAVSTNIDFDPWWTTPTGGTGSGTTFVIPSGATTAQIQAVFDCAGAGSTIQFEGGSYPGGINANNGGVTVNLNGGTFGPGSPWLTVNADDVTVNGPGTLDGNGNASPAILVNAGADNFILNGVEIREWADGVELAGSVTSFKLVNNWIHSNTDAGLQVNSGVSIGGVTTIQGNLFKVNGGKGVQNDSGTSINAEYNSWGADQGPTASGGDGVSANVDYDPWTFAEVYLDVDPITFGDQVVRGVNESTSFNVDLKVDGENLYGVSFRFTYDPNYLTFNAPPTFVAPWAGNCTVFGSPPSGTFAYTCYLTSGPAWDGGTVATFNFTANGPSLTGDGPWSTTYDISHLTADTNAGAQGGVKVFVNNAGYNAPSTGDRDITDANDGQIDITGIAKFTGFVDVQGRPNDSGAVVDVYTTSATGGSPVASGTSVSSGKYTTNYIGLNLLTVGTTYWFQVDRALYLPTTVKYPSLAASWAQNKSLTTRPLTTLATFVLLGGDATNDDTIDINDGTCVGSAYGGGPVVCNVTGSSDVNGDGATNILDLVLFGGNYGSSASPWTP